ncbi:hypothetical protein BM477_05600 [Boudabousia marimammalium]|uniref:Uncharacterized protein n=1 Tax=Boudabousia marimammalium TaxID=156892 RepID=A0A1Q5PMC5_9ACTO|nr:hypothetical protein BM477_05600 [Boudabousia marimammalium]
MLSNFLVGLFDRLKLSHCTGRTSQESMNNVAQFMAEMSIKLIVPDIISVSGTKVHPWGKRMDLF